MKLQTRLVLAFFGLAVVPMTVLTVHAWVGSQRAFRQAVREQASQLAAEMDDRIAEATQDLSQRISRLENLPFEDLSASDDSRRQAREREILREFESAMGDAARLVEAVEFVPGVEPPAVAELPEREVAGSAPAVAPVAPAPPAPAAPETPGRVVVVRPASEGQFELDLADAPARWERFVEDPEALEAGRRLEALAREQGLDQRLAEVARSVQEQFAAAEQEEASLGHRLFLRLAREVAQATQEEVANLLERDYSLVVTRGGEPVGRIQARIRTEDLLNGVLDRTRRAEGEIPFAFDAEGKLHTPDPDDLPLLRELGVESGVEPAESPGDWIVARRDSQTGLTLGVARPVGAALREIRDTAMRNLAYGLGIAGIAILGIVPLSRRMTRDLGRLADAARRAASGNLDVRVPVRSNDEIGDLARAFNQMTADLRTHQQKLVEQERIAKELELSRRIQAELLPHGPLRLPFAEVLGVSVPAKEVGGDFFNYFELPDGGLALLVGDVSGKGVGAALLMANVQATLRARLPLERDLAALSVSLDAEVDSNTPRSVYLTLFLATFDAERRELRYVNGGHNPPFLLRSAGDVLALEPTGRPPGLLPGGGYEERRVAVEPGDVLFFYTDGLVENENETGEPFGTERLRDLALSRRQLDPGELIAAVEGAARDFRGSHEPDDDATMMILKLGAPTSSTPG